MSSLLFEGAPRTTIPRGSFAVFCLVREVVGNCDDRVGLPLDPTQLTWASLQARVSSATRLKPFRHPWQCSRPAPFRRHSCRRPFPRSGRRPRWNRADRMVRCGKARSCQERSGCTAAHSRPICSGWAKRASRRSCHQSDFRFWCYLIPSVPGCGTRAVSGAFPTAWALVKQHTQKSSRNSLMGFPASISSRSI